MSDPNVIVKQFKKLISISLKNESINLHARYCRIQEHEVLSDEIAFFDENINDAAIFIENRVKVMNFDMIVKNDLLYAVLSSWKQRHRDIIYLSFCEQWSDNQIGELLKMSRSNVQRIKKRLQKELESKLIGGSGEDK
jgi:RNA polymerase sigma factor (sigma-70 family)